MQIRPMRETDLAEVEFLAAQLGYPTSGKDLRRRFREIDGYEDYALLVALLDDGTVAGYIQVNFEPKTLLSEARADIAALIVRESHRSRGIGAELVAAAEVWARSKGISLMRVRSNAVRLDAHRFYVRQGYTVSKTSSIFVKSLD